MLCCILSASEHIRSLLETPAVLISFILTTILSFHDMHKLLALGAVIKHFTEECKPSKRAASQPYASVCDAFVALMNEILTPPTMKELCRATAKMLGVVTLQADSLEVEVQAMTWEAVEANLVSLRVDDWVAQLMAESSVDLQTILLHNKFVRKFKTLIV